VDISVGMSLSVFVMPYLDGTCAGKSSILINTPSPQSFSLPPSLPPSLPSLHPMISTIFVVVVFVVVVVVAINVLVVVVVVVVVVPTAAAAAASFWLFHIPFIHPSIPSVCLPII